MAVLVPSDNHTFKSKAIIQEISKDFLTALGFSYFQYLRCYADGSTGLLTNDTRLMEQFKYVDNAPVVYSSFEEEHKNHHSYWFLWDEKLPEFPVTLAREFNIHNGITLVRRSKYYYDMIAVALPHKIDNPGSFYLNKLKAIEQFVNEFDRNNKDLLDLMNHNPIVLPESYRDGNYKQICLTKGKIAIQGKDKVTHITSQELACLRLLVQGISHKEIAQMLSISPRTVETYVQRIKQRTGYYSRLEIEHLLST